MPKGKIKRAGNPVREIRTGGNPDSILSFPPSWAFASCDRGGSWAFCGEKIGGEFWSFIFPKLQSFERQTLADIFIKAKKQNHSIEVSQLNKAAQERLNELQIEAEAVRSLRLSGSIRLYGILIGSVFNILWYDTEHGDNDRCVCRSTLKHT